MVTCYCDTDGLPTVSHRDKRKARKEHRCYECGCKIAPGETYEVVSGLYDGQWETFKTCPDCVELRDALTEMDCFCWYHGSLLDDIQNQFLEAKFSPGLRFNYLRIVATHRWRRRQYELQSTSRSAVTVLSGKTEP